MSKLTELNKLGFTNESARILMDLPDTTNMENVLEDLRQLSVAIFSNTWSPLGKEGQQMGMKAIKITIEEALSVLGYQSNPNRTNWTKTIIKPAVVSFATRRQEKLDERARRLPSMELQLKMESLLLSDNYVSEVMFSEGELLKDLGNPDDMLLEITNYLKQLGYRSEASIKNIWWNYPKEGK